jgi:hypothetical protein
MLTSLVSMSLDEIYNGLLNSKIYLEAMIETDARYRRRTDLASLSVLVGIFTYTYASTIKVSSIEYFHVAHGWRDREFLFVINVQFNQPLGRKVQRLSQSSPFKQWSGTLAPSS